MSHYVVAFDRRGAGKNGFLQESESGPKVLSHYGEATYYSTRKEARRKINLVKEKFKPKSIQIYYLGNSREVLFKETVFGTAEEVDYTGTVKAGHCVICVVRLGFLARLFGRRVCKDCEDG
jgi:hypothetical protein